MSDRIGIKVQTEFPSVSEMQRSLNAKWKGVKNSFVGKINVDVDGNSLKSMQSKIKKALGKEVFEIKINTGNAITQVSELGRSINKLNEKIKGVSNLKIKVDTSDMKKAMSDISKDIKNADKIADAHTNKIKSQTNAYKGQQATVSKLVETTKKLQNGSTVNEVKTKHNLGNGITVDEQSDSMGRSSLKFTHDREKALREILSVMKSINKVEAESIGASKKNAEIYKKEENILKEQLSMLDKQYKKIYEQGSALDTVLAKEVSRQGKLSIQLKTLQQQQKAEKERDRSVKQALSEMTKLEQQKFSIRNKLISAGHKESDQLRRQLTFYEESQRSLMKKYDLQKNMTKEQKSEWNNLQRVNNLLIDQSKARKKDIENQKKATEEQRRISSLQKQAYQDILSSAKQVHKVEMDILKIKSKQEGSQAKLSQEDTHRLQLLNKELDNRKQVLNLVKQEHQAVGNVTKEMEKQLSAEQKVMDREKKRVAETSKLAGKQDQINKKIEQYRSITKEIGQLNRDLIYAGLREQNVIEDQIRNLKKKQSILKNNLQSQNALTDAVKSEIKAIQRAQSEQHALNRARQKAREGDKHYRDTYGVINPHSTWMNAQRMGRSIFESTSRTDDALVGVAKVANVPDHVIEEFRMNSFGNASDLGVLSNEYMNAVERWITSGKSLKESERLGKASLVGSFVGEIDPEEMVRYMSVPLNAYRTAGLNEKDVINAMNEISNNNAIQMIDLGKGYARSSGAMKDAGASFADQTAYLTAAQELTRRGGERIGTGLRTIGLNYGIIGAKNTAQAERKLNFLQDDLGIQIEKGDGELRDLPEVMKELSDKWGTMSDEDKATTKFYLAGKEHAETLGAILDGWDIVEKVIKEVDGEIGLGEMGSAYKEHSEQQDSIKFKTAELKNAWDEFIHTVAGGKDGIVAVMNAMISGLETITKLATNEDLMRALKFIAGGIGIHAGFNGLRRAVGILSSGLGGFARNGIEAIDIMKRLGKESDKTSKKARKNNKMIVGSGGAIAKRVETQKKEANKDSNKVVKSGSSTVVNSGGSSAKERTPAPTQHNQPKTQSPSNKPSGGVIMGRTPKINIANKPDKSSGKAYKEIKTSADQADKSISKTNTSMKSSWKLLKLGLGMIPLLGDALLIAEFMGAPVFDTIGKGWKKITRSTEETIKKEEEYARQFLLTNDITNGEMKKKKQYVLDLSKSYDELTDKGKKSLGEEEFYEFKDSFNKLSEDLGFDITIDMNDTAHIESKIKELKEKLNELDRDSQVELGIKLTENRENVVETLEKINKIEERRKQIKEEIATLEENAHLYGEGTANYESTMNEVENLKLEYEDLGVAIDDVNGELDIHTKASRDVATALMEQGSGLDTLMYSMSDKISILEGMEDAYNHIHASIEETTKAQETFAKKGEITQDQWVKVYETIAEKDNAFKEEYAGKTADMINADQDLRNSIGETIEKIKDEEQATLDKGMLAIEILETETGVQIKLNDKIEDEASASEKAGSKAEEAGDKARQANLETEESVDSVIKKTDSWREELLKVPTEKKTDFNILTTGKSAFDSVYEKIKQGNKNIDYTVNLKTKGTFAIPRSFMNFGKFGHTSTYDPELSQAVSQSISTAQNATGLDLSSNVLKSNSVSSDTTAVNESKSTRKKSSKKSSSSKNNSRVNQDVWRHWRTELYGINRLDKSLSDLAIQMERSKDNEAKLIKLYQKQQSLLKSQVKQYKALEKSKRAELNSVLNSLKKQGFKVDKKTGKVTNLGRAKNLKGKKAEKADQSLSKWRSLYEEITGIQTTISSLNQEIRSINDNIKEAKITKEFKSWEKPLRKAEMLLRSIDDKTKISDKRVSFVSSRNMELGLKETESAMNSHKANMDKLITEFNKLSTKKITYKENAEQIESTLQSMADSILSQADAIVEYNMALNDLRFERITTDFESFGSAFESTVGRIDNSIENLREGLLSGTGIHDLQSSIVSDLNLNRSNKYEKLAQERINLEKQVNDAMMAFAKKNVDREKKIANSTLKITKNKYNQMLKMEKQYNSGKKASYDKIKEDFGSLTKIGEVDKDYTFVKDLNDIYSKLTKEHTKLYNKYVKDLSKAKTDAEREALDDQFILDSFKLQEDYYKKHIEATERTIKELNKQLKNSNLTEDQKYAIQEQIKDYEDQIVDSQNSIKDAIRNRFEYEFELIEKAIGKYEDYANEVQYAIEILETIGGDNNASVGVLLREMLEIERARNKHIQETVQNLDKQLELYEKGSFEWNLINAEVEEYKDLLKESNKELLEIGKNIMSTSFEGLISDLEKELFDGKTLKEFERYRDLWLSDVEREIALEEIYERLADISSDVHEKRMEELEKREKLSRFEMDYLNKQLDVLELQQKIDNLNKERTVQTLKQNADGTWDWQYEADSKEIEEATEELRDAQKELAEMEEQARKEYLSKLEDILGDAEDGQFKNSEELRESLEELTSAFESIVGDYENIGSDYIDNLVDSYEKYLKDSQEIIKDIDIDTNLDESKYYEGFSKEVEDIFVDLSRNIEKSFAKTFSNEISKLSKALSDESRGIVIEKVEFPNATSQSEIEKAIINLPKIALQKSKEK